MMLNQQELQRLLKDIESDRVERTRATTKTEKDKICEAICAFANDFPNHRQPGYLFIGVDPQGNPVGISVTDKLLEELGAIRSDGNILPTPAMTVEKTGLNGAEFVIVEVFPSDLPPVRYKGRVCIRVGPRRANASEQEERILSERRIASHPNFDATPCQECTLDDLHLDLFRFNYLPNAITADILKENNRDIAGQMASLRFYDLKRQCPTVAGALLFGKGPIQWVPGAYVQFVRYDGEQLVDKPLNERRFSGDLLTLLRELDAFLPLQLQSRPEASSALQEKLVQEYPTVALRELLMNAVMHRSYESTAPIRFYWFNNRVEIQSPGGLYGEARPENFPRQNAYRNPVIAEAMKVLGYVNKFGGGVLRVQKALAANGNPQAEFTLGQATYFLVTIRRVQ